MIFPDYAFGYDHRDFFSAAMQGAGRRGRRADRHPADRDLLHPLPAADPERHRGPLPRDGRPRPCSPSSRSSASSTARPATRRSSASSTRSRPSTSPAPASSSSTAPTSGKASPLQAAGRRRRTRLLPRRRRRRRQRRRGRRRQGRLDLRPHVLRLGDALRHQAGDGSRRLQGPDDRQAFVEAIEAMTDVRGRQRAPAGRQALQRQDPPGLRPPVHLEGRGRQAQRSSTAPRSRTASTPTRSTTRRMPF